VTGSRRVLRYKVPVDDLWHPTVLHGPVVHVDTRWIDQVELWALDNGPAHEEVRSFRVFGTGQELPEDSGVHVGSVIVPGGSMVWHLFETRRG
jgi:hypothetical protein